MANTLPVIAAIPNYNMADSLAELLPNILEQGYDEVYVLDDASIDHTKDVISDFGKDVHLVAGEINIGAGGNRNRLIPHLGRECLIHFIDADMRPETERPVEVIQDFMARPGIGFAGGLIYDNQGEQMAFNYGPRLSLYGDVGGAAQLIIDGMRRSDSERAQGLRAKFDWLLEPWPNPFEAPAERRVYWTAEANLVFNSNIFAKLGGFNAKLRAHDIQDPARRIEELGLENWFNPELGATHKDLGGSGANWLWQMVKADFQIAKKYGYKEWLLPGGSIKPR